MKFTLTEEQQKLINDAIDDLLLLIKKYSNTGENSPTSNHHKMYMINLIFNLKAKLLALLFCNIKEEFWDTAIEEIKEMAIIYLNEDIKARDDNDKIQINSIN